MSPSQNEDSFVLIGIDPGTENIGVSIFYVNALDLEITAIKAFTLVGSKLGMLYMADVQSSNPNLGQ